VVKGAGLRTLSRRCSRVRLPSPALQISIQGYFKTEKAAPRYSVGMTRGIKPSMKSGDSNSHLMLIPYKIH
jgi:hypothetical protein